MKGERSLVATHMWQGCCEHVLKDPAVLLAAAFGVARCRTQLWSCFEQRVPHWVPQISGQDAAAAAAAAAEH